MYLTINMKIYLSIICIVLFISSCSIDDPKIVTVQNATVVDVSLPDTLVYQQTEIINVNYKNPTTCHSFERFDITESGQTINVRTETRFEETFDCEDTPNDIKTRQFEFLVERQDSYIFKFLSGASEAGLEFITVEVPIKVE